MAETYYALTDIIKLIDNLIAAMPTSFYNGIMAVRGGLATAPAADVVEVVRCKDCKHYVPAEDDGEMMCVKDADWCVEDGCYYGFTDSHDADWFCADGERKDGDGE